MRWSAEKLRWVLLSGAVLLACVIAAVFGMANYRAGKIWQRILARNGVNLQRETNGFTYSQSNGKRTVFTLHAAKAVPHGNQKWTLHDAVLILYAKDGRTDRIYGSQFQYDQGQGIARAVGEVHMDLEAPAGAAGRPAPKADLSFTPGNESVEDTALGQLIHVRTSGLVYVRKLGVAATDQPAEFRYKGMKCTSRGAEFDSGQNVLRLLADVHMTGTLRDAPFTLTAARADLDREANTANLARPELVSGDREGRAAHALLRLRRDGSLQTGDADDGVQLRSKTETVSAPAMHADFGMENRPKHALLSGGVTFADSNAQRPARGAARNVDLSLSEAGALQTAVADGGVTFLSRTMSGAGLPLARQLRAGKATAGFVPVGAGGKRSVLQTLHMTGAAEVQGQSPAKGAGQPPTLTRVYADDLTTTFAPGDRRSPELQRLAGVGHTQMEQTGADGAHQLSRGDALEASFGERLGGTGKTGGTVELVSAVQKGHVVLQSWPGGKPGVPAAGPSIGRAPQATFEAAAGTLTLTGEGSARGGSGAEVEDGETQLSAATIVLHQGTGDGEATGGVRATTGGENGAPATHVLAARAALLHRADLTEFFGTDAEPARLWQGGSQVEAAKLVLDGAHHTLAARPETRDGSVHAVFSNARSAAGTGKSPGAAKARQAAGAKPPAVSRGGGPLGGNVPEASRDAVEVRASAMDYNDAQHEAAFGGGMTVRGTEGTITGQHGAAFLQTTAEKPAAKPDSAEAHARPAATNLGGRLDRFVVLDEVRIRQPGRTGTGSQLTYTAATDSFVLTGTASSPPRIQDAQRGLVSGATLVFGAGDSSIVVAGTPGAEKGTKPARVHTETDLKQQ